MTDSPIHYIDMGAWPVFVGFTTDKDAFEQEMKRLDLEEGDAFLSSSWASATTHWFERHGALCCIITILPPSRAKKEQYAAMLAHEAVHVVQRMREDLSKGRHLGDETEAYLVQQIVQECLQVAWNTGRCRRIVPC